MITKLVTAPLVEPVDLESARLHLRVDLTTDDDVIQSMITAAREHVEHITRRAILTQTWDYSINAWPSCNYIKLPFGNLQSVTTVSWKDTDGASTTLTPQSPLIVGDYLVETNGEGIGRIVLPYAETWPTDPLYPSNPITVRFVCGWTTPVLVPYTIKAAVLLQTAKLYESRGEDTVGQSVHEDTTILALLQSNRLWDDF